MSRRLVIFDLDGTLYRTETATLPAVRRAAADLALPIPGDDVILSLIGERSDDFCLRLFPDRTAEELDSLLAAIGKYEREYIPKTGRLYDGIPDVLAALDSSGYIPVICSSGSIEYIRLVLECCGIDGFFAYLLSSAQGTPKSDLIAKFLSETRAEFAIVVGDRHHDLTAARDNHIPAIGAAYGYGKDDPASADFIAWSPADILPIIRRCNTFHHVHNAIARVDTSRPVIIGVNGVDTAGKSMFAGGLETYLRCRGLRPRVIHMDDFHNCREIRYRGRDEIDSYIHHAFNLDLLATDLLAPVSRGERVDTELTLLDLERDTYTRKKRFRIDPDSVVIVEGTLLYREPLNDFFDFRIFLDIGFDEVLRRAEKRDVPAHGIGFLDRYRRKYIPVQKWYLEKYAPKKHCDLVVDNTDYDRPIVVSPPIR